jgi:hypothetical protein
MFPANVKVEATGPKGVRLAYVKRDPGLRETSSMATRSISQAAPGSFDDTTAAVNDPRWLFEPKYDGAAKRLSR